MQIIDSKQGFLHGFPIPIRWLDRGAMQNSKSLSELLARGGKRLSLLKEKSAERSLVLEQVRAALPPRLGEAVVSAGIDEARLTIGVVGAVWASRLRYSIDIIRKRVSKASGVEILGVKIRVVPPAPKHAP